MAQFNPASLSPIDQAAYQAWQQQFAAYVQQNGGAIPAEVSYALAHPEYVQAHPEIKEAYDLVAGSNLPASTKAALKDFHPGWGSGGAGMDKNKGAFGNWETWLQLGLGGALGGVAAAGALGAGGAAGGSAASGTGVGIGETGATVGGLGGTLSQIVNKATPISDLFGAAGAGIGSATASAGNTQLQNALLGLNANQQNIAGRSAEENALEGRAQLGLTANSQNIAGNNAFENNLMARSKNEQGERGQALKDIYRRSIANNPNVSPYDPTGGPRYSQQYLGALDNIAGQGSQTLAHPAQYSTSNMPGIKPYNDYSVGAMPAVRGYTDYNPNTMTGAGGTQPSTLQTIGNVLSPSLSTVGAILRMLRK